MAVSVSVMHRRRFGRDLRVPAIFVAVLTGQNLCFYLAGGPRATLFAFGLKRYSTGVNANPVPQECPGAEVAAITGDGDATAG